MSAASTATSDPAPMAKLTSAAASAGASLTPSPTMPVTLPRAASARTVVGLVGRQHAGAKVIDADLGRDGRRDLAVVAGQHQHVDAGRLRARDRLRRGRPHAIGQRDHADDPAVGRDADQRLADAVQRSGVRRSDALLGQKVERTRDHDDLAPVDVDVAASSLAGDRLERAQRPRHDAVARRRIAYRLGQRMRRSLLEARRKLAARASASLRRAR